MSHQKNNKTLQMVLDGRSHNKNWTTVFQAHPVHNDPDGQGNAKKYVEDVPDMEYCASVRA